MKLTLPSNEFSPEAAAIYCDLEEGQGTAIDTYTTFKYSHNLGELALEGEPRHVLRLAERIVFDVDIGQRLIGAHVREDRKEIITIQLPMLRLALENSAIDLIERCEAATLKDLVRIVFAAVASVIESRGPSYSKRSISGNEVAPFVSGARR
jgi:hypothetical protein